MPRAMLNECQGGSRATSGLTKEQARVPSAAFALFYLPRSVPGHLGSVPSSPPHSRLVSTCYGACSYKPYTWCTIHLKHLVPALGMPSATGAHHGWIHLGVRRAAGAVGSSQESQNARLEPHPE